MSVLWPEPGNLRHGVRFWPKADVVRSNDTMDSGYALRDSSVSRDLGATSQLV